MEGFATVNFVERSKLDGTTWGHQRSACDRCRIKKQHWILGCLYGDGDEETIIRRLFRFTYRKNIPTFPRYEWITSDAGWGCMLRSSQMLMAAAMQRHTWGKYLPSSNCCSKYIEILNMFLDFYGDPAHMFSIHNIAQCGVLYDKLPGEWFGPSTASLVLRDLAHLHCRSYGGQIEVLVTLNDTIYVSEADRICSGGIDVGRTGNVAEEADDGQPPHTALGMLEALLRKSNNKSEKNDDAGGAGTADKLLGVVGLESAACSLRRIYDDPYDPLLHPPPSSKTPWRCSLLILIPLRLGISSISDGQIEGLKLCLRNKYSIGFLGGRVNHALYFVGFTEEPEKRGSGCRLLGLDPHTVYPHPTTQPTDLSLDTQTVYPQPIQPTRSEMLTQPNVFKSLRPEHKNEGSESTVLREVYSEGELGDTAKASSPGSHSFLPVPAAEKQGSDDKKEEKKTQNQRATSSSSVIIAPSAELLTQVHVDKLEELDSSKLDPSLSLAFFFRTREEFEDFCGDWKKLCVSLQQQQQYVGEVHVTSNHVKVGNASKVNTMSGRISPSPACIPLFSVEYSAPAYIRLSSNVGLACDSVNEDMNIPEAEDDDDYVLI